MRFPLFLFFLFLSYCASQSVQKNPKESVPLLSETQKRALEEEFKEGWVSENKAQALSQEESPSTSLDKARERLAWLMLLEYYELQRQDMELAQLLAKSNFFKNLGNETTKNYSTGRDGKNILYITKEKDGLQKEWEAFLPTLEQKYPSLKDRRRKK